MGAPDLRPFRHLNEDGLWPRFHWHGLARGDDGALRLAALPVLEGELPAALGTLADAQPQGGVAVDAGGTVFFTDPAGGVVSWIEGCFGAIGPVPCLGGPGSDATRFDAPAGLAIAPARGALYVADAGNHRVEVFDLGSLALVEVLEGFQLPVSLALDEAGQLYVADLGDGRVECITTWGDRAPAFGDAVRASGQADHPCAIAWSDGRLWVLDAQTHQVTAFTPQGAPMESVPTGIEGAIALAVSGDSLFIGDPGRRRIAVWPRGQDGSFFHAGDAAGYEGPVAALAIDGRASASGGSGGDGDGALWVSPGGGLAPLRLALQGSHAAEGWLWSDAITVDTLDHVWNRLHASIDLPAGSHVTFHIATGALAAPVPPPTADGLFAAPWRAVGADVTDFFIDLDDTGPQRALWIGARFANDLHGTPVLRQARVDFDQASYLPDLPGIYRERPPSLYPDRPRDNFLLRYLSLFESFFREIEATTGELPALLDPAGAPDEALDWLAGFLAVPLSQTQDEAARRASIAGAWARHARRGTAAGLGEALRDEAGVRAVIEEPLQALGWWALPAPSSSCKPGQAGTWADGGDSVLGFNTVLPASEPQGAVLGSTATLDRSRLIASDAFGTPLFEEAAYRFLVRLYPRDLHCADTLARVREIVEREKPAHTLWQLCAIAPGLRVGYQASLGVDTLLGGGPPEPGPLGEGALVLGGEPRARLGVDSRVGARAQL